MTTRRELLVALGAGTLAWAGAARGQSRPPILIGWLSSGSVATSPRTFAAFKEGMAALGWKEGSNYVVEESWADGRVDRLPNLANALAAKKPIIIVASGRPATIAATKVAPGIPIVQATGSSPVDVALAKSLARPGGMVTGIISLSDELTVKYLELLLAVAPNLKRVGFLIDLERFRHDHYMNTARSAAEHFRVEARFAKIGKAEDIDSAMAHLAKEGVAGLVVLPGFFYAEGKRIITLALAQRWPVIGPGAGWVRSEALLSYGADILVLCRRAAYYVDRILKGSKPGDLPIEQPIKFILVVNLKTAKALGITIPRWMLLQADSVIN